MDKAEQKIFVVAHAIVERADGAILLGQRQSTGYGDGMYAFPAGHVEPLESVTEALGRELTEETELVVAFNRIGLPDPALVIEHLKDYGTGMDDAGRFRHYYEFFFRLRERDLDGTLVNAEPLKCADLRYFDKNKLPQNFLPLSRYAWNILKSPSGSVPFSHFGWDSPDFPVWRDKHLGKPVPQRAALLCAATCS